MHTSAKVLLRSCLLVVALGVASCGGCDNSSTPAATGDDAGIDGDATTGAFDEFDAWRAMQAVLRKSPDHVVGHASALVAAKDAEGLFKLVRDEIELLPTTPTGFDNASTTVRWGQRATLRGAAGTPRERAELLRQLYVDAGLTADVVSCAPRAGASVAKLLAASPVRTLRWDVADADYARWGAALGKLNVTKPVAPLDPADAIRSEIKAAIRAGLAGEGPHVTTFDATLHDVPLVRATIGGAQKFANPNLDDVAFGESGCTATPDVAGAMEGERSVTVRVEGASSTAPMVRTTLVEQKFMASDVAGRTISASFPSADSHDNALRKQVGQADTFVPTLVVGAAGLDKQAAFALSAVGKPFTAGGDVLTIGMNGAITIGGETTTPPPTDATLLAKVAHLDVTVRSVAFPRIELEVSARDASDVDVPGLAADAFLVQEQGANVVSYLRRNSSPPPRVLMLFDRSTSIPSPFITGSTMIGHDIANAVFTAYPGALVEVAGLDINRPNYAGPMASDIATVDAQLAALTGSGSDVWGNLAEAAVNAGASVVVIISDMTPDAMPTDENLSHLFRGAPVLVAGVGTVDAATAARVADISRGLVLTNVTSANLAASVSAFLATRARFDYRIVYDAPASGPNMRNVGVSIRSAAKPAAMATYTAPATPIAPDALSALYLTVETDGRSVTRRIAGSDAATAADREEVHGALFGRYTLGVEANPPSFSVLLDEHVEERLAQQALIRAYRAKDMTTLATEVKRTSSRVPADLRFFAARLPDEANAADVTFIDGVSVTLHVKRPVLDKKVVIKIDMLPLTPRRTVIFAGGDGFMTTVDRTSYLAAAEAARFSTSTYQKLKGVTLGKFDPLTIDSVLGPAWAGVTTNYAGYEILAPASGTPVAFWAVNATTGEVIGGLSDGGGEGDGEDLNDLVARLQALLDAAERAGTAIGFEGISVWTTLESIKLQAVANAIATFEGTPIDPSNSTDMSACQGAINLLAGQIPGFAEVGEVVNDLQALQRLLGILAGREGPQLSDTGQAACNRLLGM